MTTIPLSARLRTLSDGPNARPWSWPAGVDGPRFVAGPENRLVSAVFSQLIAAAGDRAPLPAGANALVLVGPSGSGKTHLARGLADLWARRPGEQHVTYLTAPDFRRQLDQAIEARKTVRFREQLRASRVLVLDDLHRLPIAPYIQEELLGTFDALPAEGLLLVTSSPSLVLIPGLWPAITSRLAAGLTLELAPLGPQASGELFVQCLHVAERSIEPDAAELFARRVDGEAPAVLRAVAELCALVPRQGTIDAAQMKNYLDAHSRRLSATVEDIVRLVARYHKLSPKLLASSTRRRSLVEARGVVIYLARHLLGTSFEQLGQALGGRDHSTVMHSFHKTEDSLPDDPRLRSCIEELKRLLQAA